MNEKKGILNFNYAAKLSLIFVCLLLVISLPIFLFIYNDLDDNLSEYTQKVCNENSRQLSEVISSTFTSIINEAFTTSDLISDFNNISEKEYYRFESKLNELLSNKKYISDYWVLLRKGQVTENSINQKMIFNEDNNSIVNAWKLDHHNKLILAPATNIQINHFIQIFKFINYNPKQSVFEPIQISRTLNSAVYIPVAKPIYSEGRFIGIVGLHINAEFIKDIMNKAYLNREMKSFCVDKSGTILCSNNYENYSISNINDLKVFEDEFSRNAIKAALISYSFSGKTVNPVDNNNIYVTVTPVKFADNSFSWSLLDIYQTKLFNKEFAEFNTIYILSILIGLTIIIITILLLISKYLKPLNYYSYIAENVSKGFYLGEIDDKYLQKKNEIGKLFNILKTIQISLKEKDSNALKKYELQNKYMTGTKLLLEQMRGNQDIYSLSKNILTFLAEFLDAKVGTLYLFNDDNRLLELTASYSFTKRKGEHYKIEIGEGLLGQVALEKQIIFLTDIPEDYILINSALGETTPKNIIIAPFLFEDKLIGIIELATYLIFDDAQIEFIKASLENIGIAFNSAKVNKKLNSLYQEAQNQAEKLQTQQEELIATNEELEAQTVALRKSEHKLIEQQEELQAINEELEEKTSFLEKQKSEIIKKNEELLLAQYEIAMKAKELEQTSKYKSEFLANMSHELRTPLNSVLILAANMQENKDNNLNEDQLESSRIIHQCGIDLLNLINDILDLSKIEAGKMLLNFQSTELIHIAENLNKNFKKIVENKGLKLYVDIAEDLPNEIITDAQKLEQVIKNFVSNAVKFTSKGSISIIIKHPDESYKLKIPVKHNKEAVEICIKDTGIGIPKSKQDQIFEAFRQLESHLSRQYNGTGLGLSIAKEITNLLGGEIKLFSNEGEGSEFSIIIPINHERNESFNETVNNSVREEIVTVPNISEVKSDFAVKKELFNEENIKTDSTDDRDNIIESDKVILIIEDDLVFAKILYDQVVSKGFKCIFSPSGEEGLALADKFKPDAIILDIKLPGMNGWEVLRHLKENHDTRHIPVHMMSGEGNTIDAKRNGAVGFISKPTTKDKLDKALTNLENLMKKKIKDLLVVEDDENLRKSIISLLKADDVTTFEADSGAQALQYLKFYNIDCMVLDLTLPDMTGFDLLNILQREEDINIPPIIVYTGKDLSKEEESKILKFAESIIIKGVKSEERLIDETALFLHRVVDRIQVQSKDIVLNLHDKDQVFKGKNILLVDDDIRNAYAITKVLKEKGINIMVAENGEKAIEILQSENTFDLVLMDIMMPVMDGFTAMTKIRNELNMKKLPVIALTAKAMKEDREKCINAGANDYLSKPIDLNKLFSLLRVWLYK